MSGLLRTISEIAAAAKVALAPVMTANRARRFSKFSNTSILINNLKQTSLYIQQALLVIMFIIIKNIYLKGLLKSSWKRTTVYQLNAFWTVVPIYSLCLTISDQRLFFRSKSTFMETLTYNRIFLVYEDLLKC